MSVIAIKGIPNKWGLMDVVKSTAKFVAGPFEPLNFTAGKYGTKTCYLRLSERLDPVQIIERICNGKIKGQRFQAFVPEHVPDFPLSEKRKKIPLKVRHSLNIPELELPHEVVIYTHHEIFLELQYMYPGLYNLSRKTGHKLLDELAHILGERLIDIMEANSETRDSCFMLSKCYRKMHPHFGDFQLILSTLHRLQDASGAPRAQIQEATLATVITQPYVIENIPLEKVKKAYHRYSDRIAELLNAHVEALDCEMNPNDGEEQIARKKVREELKKMMGYLPSALRQVVMTHFVPEEPPYRIVRIYGAPFLPSRDAMSPFTKRYTAAGARVIRSNRMYNLITFKVPHTQYAALKAMDATVINGAKLTIRLSDAPMRDVSEALRSELAAHFGGTPADAPPDEDEDMEEDLE